MLLHCVYLQHHLLLLLFHFFFYYYFYFAFFTLQQLQLRLQKTVDLVGIVKYKITKSTVWLALWMISCSTSHFLPMAVSAEPSTVHFFSGVILFIFFSSVPMKSGIEHSMLGIWPVSC